MELIGATVQLVLLVVLSVLALAILFNVIGKLEEFAESKKPKKRAPRKPTSKKPTPKKPAKKTEVPDVVFEKPEDALGECNTDRLEFVKAWEALEAVGASGDPAAINKAHDRLSDLAKKMAADLGKDSEAEPAF